MNLADRLAMHAAVRPEQTALAWPDGQLSYKALLEQVEAAVQSLQQIGAQVLALDVENGPAWVVLDIAAMQLGICLIPLPPFFSPGQLDHVLHHSGTQVVLTDDPQRLRERLGELLVDAESPLPVAGSQLAWIETEAAVRGQEKNCCLRG